MNVVVGRLKRFMLAVAAIGAALVMAIVVLFIVEARGEDRYTGEMALATEYPSQNEAIAAQNIVDSLETILTRIHPAPERTRRDAHVKQHGLVKAEFRVLDGLNEKYRIGLFSQPRSYPAWLRFSSNFDKPDFEKNTRGLAIKLMDVDGAKLLPQEISATTHDFVLMSASYFPTKDALSFEQLLRALESGKPALARYLITHPRVALKFLKVDSVSADLFSIVWGSATPYLYGEGMAVKYVVKPAVPSLAEMPSGTVSEHYLRQRLVERLSNDEVYLDFFIQQQVDAQSMPIEDARVVWDEKASPLVKVATIRIVKQKFYTEAQQLYGDQLSFTPWHALPEHRPLGGINRSRKAIYSAISKFRHDRNGEVRTEPTSWSDFAPPARQD